MCCHRGGLWSTNTHYWTGSTTTAEPTSLTVKVTPHTSECCNHLQVYKRDTRLPKIKIKCHSILHTIEMYKHARCNSNCDFDIFPAFMSSLLMYWTCFWMWFVQLIPRNILFTPWATGIRRCMLWRKLAPSAWSWTMPCHWNGFKSIAQF